jgi:hypothetical protein
VIVVDRLGRRLKFHEAVELICGYRIGAGEAEALVRRGIASGEIRCAWTQGAVAEAERRAPRLVIGSSTWATRAASQQAAYDRALARLRLLSEVESDEFKDQLVAGNIVISETDLVSWYDRNTPQPATPLSLMKSYKRSLPVGVKPSMTDAWEFAKRHKWPGTQEEIRESYRDVFDHPGPGRKPK